MSLQDEIFAWVRGLPPWKQELYLRAAVSPQISAQDVEEVAALLLGEPGAGGVPRRVLREDLPGAEGGGEPMAVHSISEIRNVNLLVEDQALEFPSSGLNVVYGKNGAGKTGYTRILKHAGRTLRRETVLANIAKRGSRPPSAVITLVIGGAHRQVPLDLEAPPPAMLARIFVADSLAGEEYLTSENEVDYAPAALVSLSRLAEGLKAVGEELRRRLAQEQPSPLDLKPYGEGTEVSRALMSTSHATADEEIVRLAALGEQERALLADLRRKQGEIDAAQAPKLRRVAERSGELARLLAGDLRAVGEALGAEALQAARSRHTALVSAREAGKIAAESFAKEPLPGVGSDPWRRLWEAAREFAAHQGEELPPRHEPASCPLCMQALAPEARARLTRFEDFVKADISVQIRQAEEAMAQAREAVPDIQALRLRHGEVLNLLAEGAGGMTSEQVARWLTAAEAVRERLLADELQEPQPLEAPPLGWIEAWAAARSREAAEHAALESEPERERVAVQLAELRAREELANRRSAVLSHLAALRQVQRLKEAVRKVGTADVSNRITALSRGLIEADLHGALNRNLSALDFRGLEVVPSSRTVRGKSMCGLRFKADGSVPLNSVLSQGEQRRLALAIFLAEMEVLGESNPIVLDDPSSSVDQEGRRHIARAVCELARRHQVIVFTHELSFVHELRRMAREDVPAHFQHVCRNEGTAGHVRDGLPWEGQTAKQRRQTLHDRLGECRACFESGDPERYRREVTDFCWMLRSSFERAVEEVILDETVTRRDDTIHAKKLRDIRLDEEICELVDRGVDESSPWAHDQPLADGADPPTPAELREGLDIYCTLLDRTREMNRRREANKAPQDKGNAPPHSPSENGAGSVATLDPEARP